MSIEVRQNPNKEYTQFIKDKLKKNDFYCPCRIERTEDTKCMCLEFRTQIENATPGECHCGLYEVLVHD